MQILPSSGIDFYAGVDVANRQTIGFSTRANREAYFLNKWVASVSDCTYIKHNGSVRVPTALSTIKNCNYMSFINASFENITWYCIITDYEYVNNETTDVFYEVDPFMTFMFDYTFIPSMISRQHQSVDAYNKTETNPYRSDLYELTTSENLVTGQGVEKLYYNLKKYTDGTETDGEYLISSREVATSGAYDYDMGHNIMGVMFIAPIDFVDLDPSAYVLTNKWEALKKQIQTGLYDNAALEFPNSSNPKAELITSQSVYNSIYNGLTTGYIQVSSLIQNDPDMPNDVKQAVADATAYNTISAEYPNSLNTLALYMEIVKAVTKESQESSGAWNGWLNIIDKIKNDGGFVCNIEDQQFDAGMDLAGTVPNLVAPYSTMARGYNIVAISGIATRSGAENAKEMLNFLTKFNATCQLIGFYAIPKEVMHEAFYGYSSNAPSFSDFITNFITVDTSFTRIGHGQTSVENKKLLRFPYSYMRVVSPDGNVKEYHYEDFKDVADNGSSCKFRIFGDLNSRPSVVVAPVSYKESSGGYTYNSNDMTDVINVNMSERIEYIDFAQIPFVTDAYLTYLSGQVMDVTAKNTLSAQGERSANPIEALNEGTQDVLSTIYQGAHDLTGGWSDKLINDISGALGASSIGQSVQSGINTAMRLTSSSYRQTQNAEARVKEASKWLASGGGVSNELDYGEYNDTRPAYANNVYHPGTNGGIYQYIKGVANNIDFKLIHVQLMDSILAKYDRYFRYYGYNFAGYAGVPYVVNFMRGMTGDTNLPHWEEMDDGKYATYVQTMDCKVTGLPLVFERYIEDLFNGGVRILNGDALIPSISVGE